MAELTGAALLEPDSKRREACTASTIDGGESVGGHLADGLVALVAAATVGLVWVLLVGRRRVRASARWRWATVGFLWVLSVAWVVVVTLVLSFDYEARSDIEYDERPELGPAGPRIIETESCSFRFLGVDVTRPVYVGQPVTTKLTVEASARAPATPSSSPCGATLALALPSDDVEVVGGDGARRLHADLLRETPTWTVVVQTPAVHSVVVQVTPDSPCTARCDIPTSVTGSFPVHRDQATRRAEDALVELFAGMDVEVRQPYPLKPGVADTVEVTIRLPGGINLQDLDKAEVSVMPSFDDLAKGLEPVTIETQRAYETTLTTHLLVTPKGSHDIALPVRVGMVGARGDDVFVETSAGTIDIRVAETAWVHRVVVRNVDWVATLVTLTGVVGGFAVGIGRWLLRRRKASVAAKIGDDRSYL
jgi:hypothetical protein